MTEYSNYYSHINVQNDMKSIKYSQNIFNGIPTVINWIFIVYITQMKVFLYNYVQYNITGDYNQTIFNFKHNILVCVHIPFVVTRYILITLFLHTLYGQKQQRQTCKILFFFCFITDWKIHSDSLWNTAFVTDFQQPCLLPHTSCSYSL